MAELLAYRGRATSASCATDRAGRRPDAVRAELTVEDLPEKIRDYRSSQVVLGGDDPSELAPLEEVERRYILHVCAIGRRQRPLAARTLGLDRKTLYRKLHQYGVLREDESAN